MQGCSWPFLIKGTPLCNVFSNLFPQILKPKSTPSHHPRSLLTPLICANVRRGTAPSGLSQSIHHLVADPPSPTPASAATTPLWPGQICANQGQLVQRDSFPPLLPPSTAPSPAPTISPEQFLCSTSPLHPSSSPGFFQKHRQGNWASRSKALSDTSPLSAATSSPISAQPWQHTRNAGNTPAASRGG